MNIFSNQQENIKKIILIISLLAFILICLIRGQWQIGELWFSILLFIFAYGVGLFVMLGDEKYLQKIYSDELEEKILITRSPLFLLVLPFLSIFMLTSTGSVIGMGLIMGLNLVLLVEIWQLATNQKNFNQFFLRGVNKEVTLSEIRVIKIFTLIYFLILLFLIR